MRGIVKVLKDRSRSFEAALKTTGTVEFWKETLTQKKQDEPGSWLEELQDDGGKENVCSLHFSHRTQIPFSMIMHEHSDVADQTPFSAHSSRKQTR